MLGKGISVKDAEPGVQPTSMADMEARVAEAHKNGSVPDLPQKDVLADALSRGAMEYPVSPAQLDSIGNQNARNIYQTIRETPGAGDTIKAYEGIQKNELVNKTEQAIKDLVPGHEPVSDAIKGGKEAIDAFGDQYQTEKNALKPIFEDLRKLPLEGDIKTDSISQMIKAVPKVANMIKIADDNINVIPYRTHMGIDRSTYNAVKETIESLQESKNDFESLWNIRKGLDQHIDPLAQGQGPSEIRALKAALMDQMQASSPSADVRDAFKRYAINEQERQVIEKNFGAPVGSPEFGAISKVKPEMIGDKIF